ncbi:Assembly mitochondrial proton-transport ATP synth complex [Phytophthora infestans]|uniref:Mitochondrial proton-transport ATP synth complex n=1 Tax=Phytophthora infestans TaxID=4787 RepID=A0A833WZZ8_PHYIN|nr:Assembly mitochondrial proton-transport ATP synth complex [Phytophthora infestans]KAF4139379.1 Mitochondrial proton-transport ATP synth complex [Phytophthora infestans]KAI9995498.1 hypothetical protein PInf_012563 [Phytophthora infestans]
MFMLRTSRRAGPLVEVFPRQLSSLRSASRAAVRTSKTAVIQGASFDFSSRCSAELKKQFCIRHFSSSQSDDEAREDKANNPLQNGENLVGDLVYQAPMTRAVRLMKAVSVTSCTLTSIGMPVLCVLSEQDASSVGKWAMCGTIMLFGFGSTSLFHYLFKPYVMRMWLANTSAGPNQASVADTKDDPTVTVETTTLFAQLEQHSFRLSSVTPPTQAMHPMISFQARGRHYFIHPEAFDNQNLLNKLMGSGKRK